MVRETGRQNASGEVGDREGNGRQELESRGINFYAPAKQPTSEARQLAPS